MPCRNATLLDANLNLVNCRYESDVSKNMQSVDTVMFFLSKNMLIEKKCRI